MARWPEIVLVANHVEACDDGWTASAFVVVRGTEAPMTLRVRPVAAMPDGGRRIEATGVLDLRTTPIRAPGALIGRYVEIFVECVMRPPSRTA
ncbi:MAG: hypothetical protein ACXV3S_08385 [Kineosporiaceae bacterium]